MRDVRRRHWGVWLGATLGSFVVLETIAYRGRTVTLSAAMRHWLGIDPQTPARFPRSMAFTAFFTWLVGHITLGWGPNRRREA